MWKLGLFLWAVFLGAEMPDLQLLWQQEIEHAEIAPKRLKNKHVLFVSGMLNEIIAPVSGYFLDSREAVEQDLGGESSHFGPSSQNSISENARILYEHFLEIQANKPRSFILIGHSKGAAVILCMILQHPELILERSIDQVILIQAAIQGSAAANDPSRWLRNSYAYIRDWVGLETESLSETGSKALFNKLFEEYEALLENQDKQFISNKIFYVRSAEVPEKRSYSVELVLEITQHKPDPSIPNDGLIASHAQLDSRIGIDLGVIQADHLSLVIPWVTALSKHERRALMRAIFKLGVLL